MRNRRRRRGWSGWFVGLLVLVLLLWGGYWYAAREIANAAIERVTTRTVAGGRFACSEESLGGFPLRIDFGCQRAAYADGATGTGERVSAELGGIKATAPLYWPGYVEATLGSPFVVNAPAFGIALTTAWSEAATTAAAGLDGLSSASATFHGLDFASTGDGPLVPVRTLKADFAEAGAAPAGGKAYRFTAEARDLLMVPANGRALPAIGGEASIVAHDFGGSLGTDPRAALLNWLRTGGDVDVERAKLASGDASADATGKLTLSADGLISGTLTLRLRNPQAFADLAEAIHPGSRNDVDQALAVLTAFTTQVNTSDGPARQTTIVIRNGVVSIGVLPFAYIPPLRL